MSSEDKSIILTIILCGIALILGITAWIYIVNTNNTDKYKAKTEACSP